MRTVVLNSRAARDPSPRLYSSARPAPLRHLNARDAHADTQTRRHADGQTSRWQRAWASCRQIVCQRDLGAGNAERGAQRATGDGRRDGLWVCGFAGLRCGLSFSKDTLPPQRRPPSPIEGDPRRDVVTGPRESCPISMALPWRAPGLPPPDAALLHAVSSATRATAAAIFAAPAPSQVPRRSPLSHAPARASRPPPPQHAQHSCAPRALSWSHSQWDAAGASNPHTPGS